MPKSQTKPYVLFLLTVVIGVPSFLAVVSERGSSEAVEPPAVEINIENFAFNPGEVTVKVGQKVVWTNYDMTPP